MSGKGQGRETLPALRSLGPVEPPPWERARATEKPTGPFEKKGKVARSPPAALTPPPSEGFLEESSLGATAFPARTMSSDDGTLNEFAGPDGGSPTGYGGPAWGIPDKSQRSAQVPRRPVSGAGRDATEYGPANGRISPGRG